MKFLFEISKLLYYKLFLFKKNGTIRENITINTGYEDINKIANIHSWNGIKKMNAWGNEKDIISGSDGSMYKPFISKQDIVKIYNPDMCR